MSLWDPEAAGNAACFLRLTDIQMLEIRNAPFEGGKAVWVPNTETGYIKGEISGDGEKPNTTKVSIGWKERDLCASIPEHKMLTTILGLEIRW